MAFLGYWEVALLIFPEFSLLLRILSIVLSFLNSPCPSSQSFPPFYSDILKSQGNHWFLCFVLWSTGHVLCPSLSRFCFPVLHPFLPLVLILWKSMTDYLFRNMLRSHLSRSHFWQLFFFIFFSQMGGIKFCRFESLPLLFPFLYFFMLVPRGASHMRHERSLILSSFLAGSFGAWEGRGFPSISCVSSFVLSFRTVLIFCWLCLHA